MIYDGGPSAKTNVIVRGRPNKLQAAGADGGRKLLEIKPLRERGHRLTILTEAQFWRLTKQRGPGWTSWVRSRQELTLGRCGPARRA